MSAAINCPQCHGHMIEKARRLMYACKRCGEVLVEVPEQSPSKGFRGVSHDLHASQGGSHQ